MGSFLKELLDKHWISVVVGSFIFGAFFGYSYTEGIWTSSFDLYDAINNTVIGAFTGVVILFVTVALFSNNSKK
jgi:hypothetical protein